MAWLIGFASILISLYSTLMLHPFENEAANAVCFILLAVTFNVLLCIAGDKEENLKSRIEALEEKLKDKENTNGKN